MRFTAVLVCLYLALTGCSSAKYGGYKEEKSTNVRYEDKRDNSLPKTTQEGFSKYLLLKNVNPEYPKNLRASNIEGYVIIRYDIDKAGVTKNIHVVRDEPAGVFVKFVLDAALQWRFVPATLNGNPVTVKGVTNALYFCVSSKNHTSAVCQNPEEKARIQNEVASFGLTIAP